MKLSEVHLAASVRTPFGDFGKSLRNVQLSSLGTHVVRACLARAGVDPGRVDHLVFGATAQVDPDGLFVSRRVALDAGLPVESAALGVVRACGTGSQAIVSAAEIAAACDFRAESAPHPAQVEFFAAESKAYRAMAEHAGQVYALAGFDFNLSDYAAELRITDKSAERFVAKYVVEKVRKALAALMLTDGKKFDGYTRSILRNMVKQADRALRTEEMMRALYVFDCKGSRPVFNYVKVAPGTAGTQVSSTRQMLRFLNIAAVAKSAVDDEVKLQDNPQGAAVLKMFEA